MKGIERKLGAKINMVQAGFFRQGRGKHTRNDTLNLIMIIQKCHEFNQTIFTCFVDYRPTKASDIVEDQQLGPYGTLLGNRDFQKESCYSLFEASYSEQRPGVRRSRE